MLVVVAGAYPLRSAQLLVEVEYVHQNGESRQCEESRVGSAPASSSVRKCECKLKLPMVKILPELVQELGGG